MPDTVLRPYIEFREVSKAFGDNVVLDRVSFGDRLHSGTKRCGQIGVAAPHYGFLEA